MQSYDMRGEAISTLSLSGGSRSIRPNQCWPMWKTEGRASRANKQGGVQENYDKMMTVSITMPSKNQLD